MQPRSFGDVKQVPERAGETIVGSLARRNRPVYVLSLCSVTFSGSVESFNMAPCYVSPWYRVLTSPRGFAHAGCERRTDTAIFTRSKYPVF